MVNLPTSLHENLSHYDHSTLKTALSKAHRHKVKFNSSNSLNCNIKHDLSSQQLDAVVEKYEDVLTKLRPDKIPSRLHLRLNTSEDLRRVRIDGSPFEVRSNYNFFYPLEGGFRVLTTCQLGVTVTLQTWEHRGFIFSRVTGHPD
jgi:hypothetical protein